MISMQNQLSIGWFAPVLAAALLASGCGKKGPDGPGGPGGMVVPVVGVRVQAHELKDRIALVGTLIANEAVDIKSEIEGLIDEIRFEEGQQVKAGDVLATIDRHKLNAELAQAEANLRLAESTKQRYAMLAATRAVSKQEIDQAAMSDETARAVLERVEAQLKDATVVAPFEGVLGERLVSVGQYVSRGQMLTTLIDGDPMKAEFHVPERYLTQMSEGQRIEISVSAYPGKQFLGEVYFIAPEVNESTRTVLVKAKLPNPDGELRRGMFANLQLVLQVRERAITVPESALMMQGDSVFVYTVDESGVVAMRPVQVGVRLAGEVEILSGIAPDETVVVEGIQKIGPGATVTVRYGEFADLVKSQSGLLPVK